MDLTTIKTALPEAEQSYLEQLLSNPIKRLQEFSDIELTEEELIDAIVAAKSTKERKLAEAKRLADSRERYKTLMQPFTPEQLINFCSDFYQERFGREFIIDDDNEALVNTLARYFTNSKEFEAGSFSLNKGILIMGNVGTGKTEIMKYFQKNKKACYQVLSCPEVANNFSIYREEFDKIYSIPKENAMNDSTFFFQRRMGRCFDDLGTEEIKNDYGNKKNTMADIIMAIYQTKDYRHVHITTNLNEEEIEPKYGTRVKSRLREMFNVFVLNGNDRRK